MVVGVDKEDDEKVTRKGRVVVGEKGVGRFSFELEVIISIKKGLMKPVSLNPLYETENQCITTILPTIFDYYTL